MLVIMLVALSMSHVLSSSLGVMVGLITSRSDHNMTLVRAADETVKMINR